MSPYGGPKFFDLSPYGGPKVPGQVPQRGPQKNGEVPLRGTIQKSGDWTKRKEGTFLCPFSEEKELWKEYELFC